MESDSDFFTKLTAVTSTLDHLRTVLSHLPDSIPLANKNTPRYDFQFYQPDQEKVKLYGTTEAALNNVLKVTFAPNGRRGDDTPYRFDLLEQGPGLVAIVDALDCELSRSPGSAILCKWLDDLLQVAEHYDKAAQVVMPNNTQSSSGPTAAAGGVGEPADIQINPSNYIDDPEPIAKGPGGRPRDDRLLHLAIWCHQQDDSNKTNVFRCVGTSTGCTTAWKFKN
ncbi:hypothetical protein JVT61DRAFT_9894 [Boletus reticuloceps]|uniref:Uncharacterized protein n=1 Tax=Boletus reticuloceps TaxID=495285 RepID=A0A8I3A4X0_9AGAM|nr:hypothetical protein JVT61DRAFT_9894 [Boletus reticuloceps]